MTKPKRRHRRIGTIVYYGPTNDFATKLVATVVAEGRRGDVIAMRTWMSELGDIRSDRRVATDVTHFLSKYHVAETVTADRLLGCPHQEGVDYPMGRKCPRCPFWADIDRMTYEPIVPPEPAMSPEEVLDVLWREQREPPIEALESADAHRLALVGPLIDAIDRVVAHPARSSTRDNGLFTYAVYLLAKWRETRAYPCIVRWLSLSTEGHDTISGDLYTQDGARILAAVCDGNLEPIARLIRNPQVDEFARSVAAGALANLAAWGETPRDQVIDVFRSLINGGLERTACYVWAGVYCSAIDMEATELYPELQQAFDEGLVDPQVAGEHALDEAALIVPGTAIEDLRDRWPPIDDVAEAIAWWGGFHDASGEDYEDGDGDGDGNEFGDEDSDLEFGEPQQPYVAPAKVGRNDPCPCGSGQKFKKCHGG